MLLVTGFVSVSLGTVREFGPTVESGRADRGGRVCFSRGRFGGEIQYPLGIAGSGRAIWGWPGSG